MLRCGDDIRISSEFSRRTPVRKEVICGIIGVKTFHLWTPGRRSDGPSQRLGDHCCGGRRLSSTLVSGGLGE